MKERRERQQAEREQRAEERRAARGYDPNRPRRQRTRQPASQDEPEEQPLIFFDIESMQGEGGLHVPNLVVAASSESNTLHHWYGKDVCIPSFLEWLDQQAPDDEDDYDEQRPLTVLAHNFQGYDSYRLSPAG